MIEEKSDSADSRRTTERLILGNNKSEILIAVGIYLFFQIFYLIFVFKFMPHGDPVVNLQKIINNDIFSLPAFVGFMIIGRMFVYIFSFAGIAPALSLNLMSVIFGAIGLGAGYLLLLVLTESRKIASTSVFILGFSGIYWLFSEIGDVYSLQSSFLIISMLFFICEYSVLAGIFFGTAMLVYPLAVFLIPFYLIVFFRYRFRIRKIILFVAFSALIYLPVVVYFSSSYVEGRISILSTTTFWADRLIYQSLHLRIRNAVKEIYFLFKFWSVSIPFIIYGFFSLFRRNRFLWYCITSVTAFPLYMSLCIPTQRDPYTLSTSVFVAILGAEGFFALADFFKIRKPVAMFTVLFCVIFMLSSYSILIKPFKDLTDNFPPFLEKIEKELPEDCFIIANSDWTFGVNFYMSGDVDSGRCISAKDVLPESINQCFRNGKNIYLLDIHNLPNPLTDFLEGVFPAEYVSSFERKSVKKYLKDKYSFLKFKKVKKGLYPLYLIIPGNSII